MPTTYKVRVRVEIPKRLQQVLTDAMKLEIKRKLQDSEISKYLIDPPNNWSQVDQVLDTIVVHYDV